MTRPLVLVTDGAGFLGAQLCRFLVAQGFAVRALDIAPARPVELPAVEFIRGDIRDAAVVARAMHGVGYVVHAAAAAPSAWRCDLFHGCHGHLERVASGGSQPGRACCVSIVEHGLRHP